MIETKTPYILMHPILTKGFYFIQIINKNGGMEATKVAKI